MVLAFFVTVHLATILYAVRGGLTAGEVLARTRDNHWFFAFYMLFVLAVAVHAPIGLRNVLREWTPWQRPLARRRARAVRAAAARHRLSRRGRGLSAAGGAVRMIRASHRSRDLSRRCCTGSPASRSRCSCRCISGRCRARSTAPISSTSSSRSPTRRWSSSPRAASWLRWRCTWRWAARAGDRVPAGARAHPRRDLGLPRCGLCRRLAFPLNVV